MIKSNALDTTATSVKSLLDSHYVYLVVYLCVAIDTIVAFHGKSLTAILRESTVTPYSTVVSAIALTAVAIPIPGFRLVRSLTRHLIESIIPSYYRLSEPARLTRNPEILRHAVYMSQLKIYAIAMKHQMLWEMVKEHDQLARSREQVRDLQFCTAIPLIALGLWPWFHSSIFAELGLPKFLINALGWYFLVRGLSRDNAHENISIELGPDLAKEVRTWCLAQEASPIHDEQTKSAPNLGGAESR